MNKYSITIPYSEDNPLIIIRSINDDCSYYFSRTFDFKDEIPNTKSEFEHDKCDICINNLKKYVYNVSKAHSNTAQINPNEIIKNRIAIAINKYDLNDWIFCKEHDPLILEELISLMNILKLIFINQSMIH